jgi:SAM-dependent methyltransferase
MPQTTTRHEAWAASDSYDAYMGRWSRPVAALFLDWLARPDGLHWLDLGCGTGARTEAILRRADPASILARHPSQGFVARARSRLDDPRIEFRIADATSLSALPTGSREVAVAGLVLNFIADRAAALHELRRVVRPGGTVAFYVWDYPGGGIEFMRAFWTAATALDPAALDLTEDRRFPFCTREGLLDLARKAGLKAPEATALECPSVFPDVEDYWHPLTLGSGPAPGYCANLDPEARERLRARLSATLPRREDGSIALGTRAWAVRARVT